MARRCACSGCDAACSSPCRSRSRTRSNRDLIEAAITAATNASEGAGERGAAVTPRILAAIAEATGGRTIPANLALAEHNAEVAALVATAFTQP